MKHCIIIGGGIIGLCSAYYLHKEGHQVTIIDQSSATTGASYVNAGYLTPSHIIPLAAPGVMKKGIKWMFNPTSPLFIKPRMQKDFIQWAWAFNKSCTQKNVSKNVTAIKDINLFSSELYSDIKADEQFNFHLEKKGLLMLCQTEKVLEEETRMAAIAREEGLPVTSLSLEEIKNIEPEISIAALGALLYRCDGHTTPQTFMEEMRTYLTNVGVDFLLNEKVTDIITDKESISSVVTSRQSYKADEYVLAAGSWSHLLSKKLGLKILLEGGKGYSINSTRNLGINMPAILCEAKVAVTPMQGFTRFAGTMEIAGINHDINPIRVQTIANAANRYYPEIQLMPEETAKASCGLRPVSPDGMAYIGKSEKCSNLTIATGHAMMGWSMGPATGKLVSEIISGQKTSLDLSVYHPDRSF